MEMKPLKRVSLGLMLGTSLGIVGDVEYTLPSQSDALVVEEAGSSQSIIQIDYELCTQP